MRHLFTMLFSLCLPFCLMGQIPQMKPTICGRVVNTQNEPLPGAHVWFVNPIDSLQRYGSATDEHGNFTLQVSLNLYEMRVSFVGYTPYSATVQAFQDMTLPDICLTEAGQTMDEVQITARRITYSTQGYKANIAAYPIFKEQTLDNVLRFLPGLTLQQDQLMAYNQSIQAVYVNNRKIRLQGKELVSYLNTFEAKTIQSVEVLNSTAMPGSVAGAGSIIKITTIQSDNGGTCTIGVSGSEGTRDDFSAAPRLNAQIKAGKWSIYAVANYNPGATRTTKKETETDYFSTSRQRFEEETYKYRPKNSLSYNMSIGYDFNKNSSLVLDGNVNYRKQLSSSETSNKLSQEGDLLQQSTGLTSDQNKRTGYNLAADYQYKLPRITILAEGLYARNQNDMDNMREQTSTESPLYNTNSLQDNSTYHFWNLRGGARWQFNSRQWLSQFVEYSNWNNHTLTDARATSDGEEDPYNTYQSDYLYKENSFTAHTGYGYTYKAWDISLGFRIKHTDIRPLYREEEQETSFKRSYTDFLPYASITYLLNGEKGHSLNFQYSRIISYPGMRDLSPNIRWNSEYAYSTGNPNLEPMLDNLYVLQTTLFGYTLTTSYTTKHNYLRGSRQQEGSEILVSAPESGHKTRMLSFALSAPFTPCKGWMLSLNGNYTWAKSIYLDRKAVSNNWAIDISSMNSLPWDMSLLLTAYLCSSSKDVYMESSFPTIASASLSRSFLNNRLNVSLNVNYMEKIHIKTHMDDYYSYNRELKDNISVGVSLRYTLKWGSKRPKSLMKKVNMELDRMGE